MPFETSYMVQSSKSYVIPVNSKRVTLFILNALVYNGLTLLLFYKFEVQCQTFAAFYFLKSVRK